MEQQIDLKKIYDELKKIKNSMITRKEMDKFMETISILSNDETMRQIISSEREISEGKIKEIKSVDDI